MFIDHFVFVIKFECDVELTSTDLHIDIQAASMKKRVFECFVCDINEFAFLPFLDRLEDPSYIDSFMVKIYETMARWSTG